MHVEMRQTHRLICGQGFIDDGNLATEFSVTPCSCLQCCVRLGVNGIQCFEKTVTITIRKTSDLNVMEDLAFANNGRNGELTDRLREQI